MQVFVVSRKLNVPVVAAAGGRIGFVACLLVFFDKMPGCTVAACKNTSRTVNYKKDGISFHT